MSYTMDSNVNIEIFVFFYWFHY